MAQALPLPQARIASEHAGHHKPVLLTVSGKIARDAPPQIERGERPRIDYYELAQALNADLIDYAAARQSGGPFQRMLERIGGPNLVLAWACFQQRKDYKLIFTDGEQVGIPLALFLALSGTRPRHMMVTHTLSTPKKTPFFDLLKVQRWIDKLLIYSSWQAEFIQKRWKLPADQLILTPFMVDTQFFNPERVTPNPTLRPLIGTAGKEARDYPTLLKAVEGLDVDVRIAAGSLWSKRADSTRNQVIPPNVRVNRYSYHALRQIYADCRFVVVPLENVDFQAGITTILEAMAMGKAVICSRTRGQSDAVVEGETGLYVTQGDPAALRQAIEYLLAHPAETERMGAAGRRRIEQAMSLEHYTARLRQYVDQQLAMSKPMR